MSHYESPEKSPQAVSRLGLYLPVALLGAVALGWSGFWYFVSRKTDEALAAWTAAEKAAGRNWECKDKEIGGFPFRIELHCSALKLSSASLRAEMGAVHAATQIYSPKLMLADISGPLLVDSAGVTSALSWKDMRVSVRFGRAVERLSVTASDFKAGQNAEMPMLSAKNAEVHLRTDTNRPSEDNAADFVLRLDELRSADLDPLVGNKDAGAIELSGTTTQVLRLPAGSWQNALETWRAQNGQLFIDAGRIAKGNFVIDGKGVLSIDPARRLQGDLNVSVRGVAPIVSRFVSGNAAQLAGALLERKDGSPVQLPLRLQEGRISLGPLRTGPVLTPLY